MNKFVFTIKMVLAAVMLVSTCAVVNAAGKRQNSFTNAAQNRNGSVLSAYDLRNILRYVLKRNDVFQGYTYMSGRQGHVFRIRIFNKQYGRVRYVFVDAVTKRIIR